MTVDETLSFLTASSNRADILAALAAGLSRPSGLVAELDCSRASVHRHLSALTDRGWAAKRDGAYRLTPAGQAVYRVYDRTRTALACLDRYGPLVETMPDVEPRLQPETLEGGTLTVADADTPHAPVEQYVAWLADRGGTDRLRCVAPVLSGVFEAAHEDPLAAGTRTELLLPAPLFESAVEDDPEAVRDALGRPAFTLHTLPEDLTFGLTVADGAAFLGTYDADGRMRAGFASERDAFRSWAREVYDRLRTRADPVEEAEVPTVG